MGRGMRIRNPGIRPGLLAGFFVTCDTRATYLVTGTSRWLLSKACVGCISLCMYVQNDMLCKCNGKATFTYLQCIQSVHTTGTVHIYNTYIQSVHPVQYTHSIHKIHTINTCSTVHTFMQCVLTRTTYCTSTHCTYTTYTRYIQNCAYISPVHRPPRPSLTPPSHKCRPHVPVPALPVKHSIAPWADLTGRSRRATKVLCRANKPGRGPAWRSGGLEMGLGCRVLCTQYSTYFCHGRRCWSIVMESTACIIHQYIFL